MKRRAGSKPVKTRLYKDTAQRRDNEPKRSRNRSSTATREAKITQLIRERDEALKEQTARGRCSASSPARLLICGQCLKHAA